MHIRQYDYILKLGIITQNCKLKISKSVNLSPVNWEGSPVDWEGYSYLLPPFLYRHTLMPLLG